MGFFDGVDSVMNCREVRKVVFLITDNEAGQEVVVSFERHIEGCPECAQQARYMQQFLMMVRQRCCRVSAPANLRMRILESMQRRAGWEGEE